MLAELPADAAEDLRDTRLGDAEHLADLGARELLDVDEGEDLPLALVESLDRGAHMLRALAREERPLRVVRARRGLDEVADLARDGIARGAHRRVPRDPRRAPEILARHAQLGGIDAEDGRDLVVGRRGAVLRVQGLLGL